MPLASLGEVISNQAHKIQTPQKGIKDSTALIKTGGNEVCSIHQFSNTINLLNQTLDYILKNLERGKNH